MRIHLPSRRHGFRPRFEKTPHAAGQPSAATAKLRSRACRLQLPSPPATTTEPVCPRVPFCNKRSHLNEKPVHHN